MKLPSDWSDVLSPVVVKEVRQGIRAKVFVGAFLITQMLMVFAVFMALVSEQAERGWVTGFFWTLVGVPLLIVMPARGLQAVGSEIRDETIDLVFLSRLSAWRIMLGKWAALAAQSILLVSSLLPYMVLRYFVGSVNLLEDLLALGVMLGISILLASGAVGVSAFQPRGKKASAQAGFIVLGLIVLTTFGPPLLFGVGSLVSGRTGLGFFTDMYVCLFVLGPVLTIFLLQIGASRIAPPAENHAIRKRATALVTLVVAGALSYWDVARPLPILFATGIVSISILDAISERVPKIYSIYLPFAKRGLGGRLFGRFFYPGWASGTVFTLLAVTILYLWAHVHPDTRGHFKLLGYVGVLGAIFWPVAWIRLIRPDTEKPLPAYFAIQAITAVMTSGAVILSQLAKNDVLSGIMSIIPLSYAIIDGLEGRKFRDVFAVGGSVVTAATMIIVLWRARQSFLATDALVAEVSRHDEAKSATAFRQVDEMAALPAQELTAAAVAAADGDGTDKAPPPLPATEEAMSESNAPEPTKGP